MLMTSLKQIETRIKKIKMEIQKTGEMRPGSLTQQFKIPKERTGPYYQLSFTHKMKSRTVYVRQEFAKEIKQQVKSYRRFKGLMEEWVELAIRHSQLKLTLAKKGKSK